MSNQNHKALIDSAANAFVIKEYAQASDKLQPREVAAFVLATLSTCGRLILADPSGRDPKKIASFLEQIIGQKAFFKYCSDQTAFRDFLETDLKLRPLILCERIEALTPQVQSLLGEALRHEENKGVILLGFVDSRAEAENLSEPLRMAFSGLLDMDPVPFDFIKSQLEGSAPESPKIPNAQEIWSNLVASIALPVTRPVLADAIANLSDGIPQVDSQAVMSPPRIEFMKQLDAIVTAYRAILSQADDLSKVDDLPRDICVWVLAHRLLRIDSAGKTNVAVILGARRGISQRKTSKNKEDSSSDLDQAVKVCRDIMAYLNQEVIGRGDGPSGDGPDIGNGEKGIGTVRLILTALFSQGHILFEDYPGTGKSFMVEKLSECLYDDIAEVGIDIRAFRRIQCVPDLMPSDITGFEALGPRGMSFKPGPIFSYFLLLDEINRTTPKVQSALLEAMAEKRVTIGNHRYDLGCVFFVLATQNPLDNVGTNELPAAQLDRFIFKRRLGPVGDDAFSQIVFKQAKGDSKNKFSAPRIPISELSKAIETVQRFGGDSHILNKDMLKPLIQHVCNIVQEHIIGGKYNNGEKIPSGSLLKEGSKPSPRSAQKVISALKALAFIEAVEKGSLEHVRIRKEHLQMIGQDYFSHRIFPVDEETGLRERNALVSKIIAEAIARLDEGNDPFAKKP
jgi:MoxR-like ATPase